MEHLEHFNGIVLSLAWILTQQHGIRGGNCLFKTPGNGISETLNFKMSLVASAFQNLCLWCEFQSYLLLIISLSLKNFLTALLTTLRSVFFFQGVMDKFAIVCRCLKPDIFHRKFYSIWIHVDRA